MSFKDKLKALTQLKEVKVEAAGQEFTVREMTGVMRDFFNADQQKRVKFVGMNPDLNTLDTEGTRGLVVAMTLIDDDTGDLAFDYKSEEDIATIGQWSSSLLEVLVDAAFDICGLSAEEAEEAVKN